jgi:hypothetical protein
MATTMLDININKKTMMIVQVLGKLEIPSGGKI